MKTLVQIAAAVTIAALGVGAAGIGCGSSSQGAGGGGDDGGSSGGGCYGGGSCSGTPEDGSIGGFADSSFGMGLQPTQCPDDGTTSISGRVYDPAFNNPLFNVTVWVPATPPTALPSGLSCTCDSLYTAPVVAVAVTDANGDFSIKGTPSGATVPIVVQAGKWRMQYTVKNVTACQDNPQPDKTFRLPRNHTEGDIPQIAISTGFADSLECLPIRMGIDPSEYVAGPGTTSGMVSSSTGRLHIYTSENPNSGAGAALQGGTSYDPGQTLWDQDSDIEQYDVVLLSCEGAPTAHLSTSGQQVILDYANNGGRVFASHYHYAVLTPGPFSSAGPPLATWYTSALNEDNDPIYGKVVTTLNNTSTAFPEGANLAMWLGNVGALTNGELEIHYARDNAQIVAADTKSQPWILADKDSLTPGYAQYFSFDTPLTGSETCGRVVYSDLHVSGGPNNSADPNTDYPGFDPGIVPDGCTQHALTPQEKALEFMIFDLSSCLTPPGSMPVTPVVQ